MCNQNSDIKCMTAAATKKKKTNPEAKAAFNDLQTAQADIQRQRERNTQLNRKLKDAIAEPEAREDEHDR